MATKQLPEAVKLRPDVVLIAVCANDVTHLTSTGEVRRSLTAAIDGLQAANPAVKIVLTGSPQMGSVPRFPQPARAIARLRAGQMNAMVAELASSRGVTFARIADETGPTFDAHPDLFAADKFHPPTAGYQVWTPVLNRAIDAALQ